MFAVRGVWRVFGSQQWNNFFQPFPAIARTPHPHPHHPPPPQTAHTYVFVYVVQSKRVAKFALPHQKQRSSSHMRLSETIGKSSTMNGMASGGTAMVVVEYTPPNMFRFVLFLCTIFVVVGWHAQRQRASDGDLRVFVCFWRKCRWGRVPAHTPDIPWYSTSLCFASTLIERAIAQHDKDVVAQILTRLLFGRQQQKRRNASKSNYSSLTFLTVIDLDFSTAHKCLRMLLFMNLNMIYL